MSVFEYLCYYEGMQEGLNDYLNTLNSADAYRVDAVLSAGGSEITERVYLVGHNGEEFGPFIRKRFTSGDASGPGGAYERIWAEQKRGRRFAHIPRLMSCGVHDDELHVVLEYVEGRTLADVIAETPSAERPLLATALIAAACDAAYELHTAFKPPMIHRDLKPTNIIVSDSAVTLIDLGIARSFLEGKATDTACLGTREYAPPEQFGFGQTDERSDIYSLGMTLGYCLAGEAPSASLRNAGFADPRIPEALRPVLAKATQLDADRRYADALEMKEALQAAYRQLQHTPSSGILNRADSVAPEDIPCAPLVEEDLRVRTAGTVAGDAAFPAAAPMPDERVSERSSSAVSDGFQSSFKAIRKRSTGAAIVWDAMLLLVGVLFFIVTTDVLLDPNSSLQGGFVTNAFIGYTMFVVIPLVLVFPFFDKRFFEETLESRFPYLSNLAFGKLVLICVLIAAALFVIMMLVAAVLSILGI